MVEVAAVAVAEAMRELVKTELVAKRFVAVAEVVVALLLLSD